MLLRVLAAGVLGVSLLAAPGVASADATTIRWSAPPECPREPALRGEIERLLGRPIDASGRHGEVSGEVTREPSANGRYRLRLSIVLAGGQRRERRIEGGSCALVTSAAAVVIALAIDAGPPREERDPGVPSPAPAIEEVPPETAPSPSPRPPPPSPTSGRVWELAAIQAVDFRSLPSPSLGLGLRGAVDLGADRLELQFVTWLGRQATLKGRSEVGADVALHTAGARYCRWLVRRMLDLAPCAGIEGGAVVASGFGALPTTGVGRWLAPQIGLMGVVRPSPRFAVSIEVDGLAPVLRDRFTVLGGGELYRPPPTTVRAAILAQVRFP